MYFQIFSFRTSPISLTISLMLQVKRCLLTCAKCTDSDSFRTFAKSGPSICSPLIQSIAPNDSLSGQRRPWSDCADAQSDLGLRCPRMLEDTFPYGAAHIQYVEIKLASTSENVPSDVSPAKIQTSLWNRAVWSEIFLSAFWIDKDAKFLHSDDEYAGGFESWLVAHIRRYIFSRYDSNNAQHKRFPASGTNNKGPFSDGQCNPTVWSASPRSDHRIIEQYTVTCEQMMAYLDCVGVQVDMCLCCSYLPYGHVAHQFVCVEVLRPSQPNEVMSSAVSLPNHTLLSRLSPLSG